MDALDTLPSPPPRFYSRSAFIVHPSAVRLFLFKPAAFTKIRENDELIESFCNPGQVSFVRQTEVKRSGDLTSNNTSCQLIESIDSERN